ncbi:MAG: hypothetical protein ACRCUT_11955, partial [Spirochaetota bacterium]
MERIIKTAAVILSGAILLISGFFGGAAADKFLAKEYIRGSRLYVMASVPQSRIVRAAQGISDDDLFVRTASWYSLMEMNLAD